MTAIEMKPPNALPAWQVWLITSLLALLCLWLVFNVYRAGQPLWALALLAAFALSFYVFLGKINFAFRYLFPGLAGMIVFAAFPLLYTFHIGLTNYSSANLLSQERAAAYLLEQSVADEENALPYSLQADGNEFRILLARGSSPLVSPRLALLAARPTTPVTMQPLEESGFTPTGDLSLKEVLRHRDALMQLTLMLPNQVALNYAGVREFAPLAPLWKAGADGTLIRQEDGAVFYPNTTDGWFEARSGAAAGQRLQPGFKVFIGLGNYARMIRDEDFSGPFISIFIWTVTLSGLTVFLALAIGMSLAVVLNWEALRFRALYRTLLFLPYAVPGFISILVFKGLFNQNFGEINTILNAVFGIKPAWFADPLLAKVMIVIVNTWLGYPYFMILSSALIKAIPVDLYEASAIAGARPLTNFFRITAPLVIKPLVPLLISAFAFNFNNFVLIALLTNGSPDYLNTKLPAGTTDILVSYTYRIAFQDSGQNYGLAAAISTVIFVMVALMSIANFKLARRA